MKKTLTFCDGCGREIAGTFRVRVEGQIAAEAAPRIGGKFLSDVCTGCAAKAEWVTYYRRPAVQPEAEAYRVDTSATCARPVSTTC